MELMRYSSSSRNRFSLCCRGTTINDLPDALLIEIFLQLPLKSAKLCMIVCKHWCALISNSDFGNCFFQLNYTSTLLISYRCERNRKLFISSENSIFRSHSFSLSYLPCGPVGVVASCGDLLLCCSDINLHSVYYICNPLTGKWIQLPPTCFCPLITVTGFIFQGQGINFKYAVVRLPWRALYKAVYNESGAIKFETFTSESGNWSEKVWIFGQNKYQLPFENCVGIPYKGMLFWISCLADFLVGVDPFSESEQIHFTALPPRPTKFRSRELAVCRGILKLLETEMNDSQDVLSIRVWDIKDFGKNEWELKHHINFCDFQSKHPSWFKNDVQPEFCPIAYDFNNDGNIMYILIGEMDVLQCNMNKQTLDVIHDGDAYFFHAFVYELPWQPTAIPSLLHA